METTPGVLTPPTASAPSLSSAPSRRSIRVPQSSVNTDDLSASPSAVKSSTAKTMEATSISTASTKPRAKGYDLELKEKDKGKRKATSDNPTPWRHPDELPFVGRADWSQDLMMEYMRYNSFSVPSRDPSSSVQLVPILLWGSLPPSPDPVTSDSSVAVWLPRGYRVPLMFVAKFQWESLRLVLDAPDPKADWDAFKFNILHLSRICQHLFQQAREARRKAIIVVDSSESKAMRKARGKSERDKAVLGGFDKSWRCPMFDRLLTRFYQRWFLSTDHWLAKFLDEFDEEEYHEEDVVRHDWARWALKGHKGFILTKEEIQNGITAEEYMCGLTTVADGDSGRLKWIWDNNRAAPPNTVSGWSITGSELNLGSVQVKREIVEFAMARDVDHATKAKIIMDPQLIARFPEITNPPKPIPSPTRAARMKTATTSSVKTPTKPTATSSASASAPVPPVTTAPLRFTTMPESSTPAVGVPALDKSAASKKPAAAAKDVNATSATPKIQKEGTMTKTPSSFSAKEALVGDKRKRTDDAGKEESISSADPAKRVKVKKKARRSMLSFRPRPRKSAKPLRNPSPPDDDDNEDKDEDEEDEGDNRSKDRSYVFQRNPKKQKTDSATPSAGGTRGNSDDVVSATASKASTPARGSKVPGPVNGSAHSGKKAPSDKASSSSTLAPASTNVAGKTGVSVATTILSPGRANSSTGKRSTPTPAGTPAVGPPLPSSAVSFSASSPAVKPSETTSTSIAGSATQPTVTTVVSREAPTSVVQRNAGDIAANATPAARITGSAQIIASSLATPAIWEPAALKITSEKTTNKATTSSPSVLLNPSSAINTSSSLSSGSSLASDKTAPVKVTTPSLNQIEKGSSTPATTGATPNETDPFSSLESRTDDLNGATTPPISPSTTIANTNAQSTDPSSDTDMNEIEAHVSVDSNHSPDSPATFNIARSAGSESPDSRDAETNDTPATDNGPTDDRMDVDYITESQTSTPRASSPNISPGHSPQSRSTQGQTESVGLLMVQGNRAKSLHTILLLRDLLQFLRVPGWGNLREMIEKRGRRSSMIERSAQYALLDDEEVMTVDHRLDILAHASVAMAKVLFPYRGEELASKIDSLDSRLQQQFDMLWKPEDRPPLKDHEPQANITEEKEVQTIQSGSSSKEIQTIEHEPPKPELTPPRFFSSQEIQAFESVDFGDAAVQTDPEVAEETPSLGGLHKRLVPLSPDATMVDLTPPPPVAGTSTSLPSEQRKPSTPSLEHASPTAKVMMSIMRNIANLLESSSLDDIGTKSVKGKEREMSVTDVDMSSPDRHGSSPVVDAIVSEFRAMKEELRQSQQKTHLDFESLSAIHRTEVESLKNELRSRDDREKDELEVIEHRHREELDNLRETIRMMEREKEKTVEMEEDNRIPTLELLELRRRISSLEARARTDPSETMQNSQAASPSVSHFYEQRQTTFHPLGHLLAHDFEDSTPSVASPASRPFVRETSTPNPGTPVSTGNPFSSRHDGMDLDENMPLPIKSQRKMHMMFPRPSVG